MRFPEINWTPWLIGFLFLANLVSCGRLASVESDLSVARADAINAFVNSREAKSAAEDLSGRLTEVEGRLGSQ